MGHHSNQLKRGQVRTASPCTDSAATQYQIQERLDKLGAADIQDAIYKLEIKAASAAACQDSTLANTDDKGNAEQQEGLVEQGTGHGSGGGAQEAGDIGSVHGDEAMDDDEEEEGGNMTDSLEDFEDAEEEGAAEGGESHEDTEQGDDDEDLADEMEEEEYDEEDEEAELLAAIQRERKMQVQLKGASPGKSCDNIRCPEHVYCRSFRTMLQSESTVNHVLI